MVRDPDKEYSKYVFIELCNEVLGRLPETAKDAQAGWEARREAALEQLLCEVQRYARTNSINVGLEDMPRWMWLEEQIIYVLEQHWSLRAPSFQKRPVIREFVEKAVSEKP